MERLQLLSWNVNGIRSVERNGFCQWIEKAQPDILGLQEIKAEEKKVPSTICSLPGYHAYWNPAIRKGYSGVGVLTKVQPKFVQKGFGIKEFDDEGRVLLLEFEKFVFINVYFPNGGEENQRVSFKLSFYDKLFQFCDKLRKQGKRLVICGDYNTAHKEIDLKNPKSNAKSTGFLPEERAWMDKIISMGYVDTLRHFNKEPGQYSWWSYRFNCREKNIGWRVDYHFVSEDLLKNLKAAYILPQVYGSDHCPVGIDLQFD